ncbi:hypothetical protein GCM10010449_50120 [Streptomyces rectiviolaceus]|uniref:Secreted protein n=1 Tax=Streptomyces rectiviolaceus TaxID=332591 RepID=A0ABP6MQ74_9ACTN
MLDAGADASVFGVVLLLAAQEWASGSSAVRDDQTGAQVGAVGDDGCPGRDGGQVRFPPGVGVGLVPGDGAGRGDHQAAVRIDDDLHIRREPIVARGRGDRTVTDRDEGSVNDPQPFGIRDRAAAPT